MFFEYVCSTASTTARRTRRLAGLLRGVQGEGEPDSLQRLGGLELSAGRRCRASCAFQAILLDAGITTTVRWSKGEDIGAACGQLQGDVPSHDARRPPVAFATLGLPR